MSEEILVDRPLRDGSIVLAREETGGENRLHFRVSMNTRHPAGVVFEQIVLGLTDSTKSWIWPLEWESTPEPLDGEPHVGCITRMTYRVPRFDDPDIPAKPVTYSYEWRQYDPDRCLLEYRGVDHPVRGGAVVQVVPLESGSQLRWVGAYTYGPAQALVIDSIIHYFPLLYDKFEELLRAGPERLAE